MRRPEGGLGRAGDVEAGQLHLEEPLQAPEQREIAYQRNNSAGGHGGCLAIQAKKKRFLHEKEGLLLKPKQKTQTAPIW